MTDYSPWRVFKFWKKVRKLKFISKFQKNLKFWTFVKSFEFFNFKISPYQRSRTVLTSLAVRTLPDYSNEFARSMRKIEFISRSSRYPELFRRFNYVLVFIKRVTFFRIQFHERRSSSCIWRCTLFSFWYTDPTSQRTFYLRELRSLCNTRYRITNVIRQRLSGEIKIKSK